MEIERKWLIDINKIPYVLDEYAHWDIIQAYISFKPTIRIRKIENLHENILTIKSSSKNNGLSRDEYEIEISDEEFNNLLNKTEGIILSKTRYRLKEDIYLYEIDIFHNEYEGLGYLEIEFESEEEAVSFIEPSWIIKELTYDVRYTNASLAKNRLNINDILNK
ncbi:MAG: hypothetical protein Q4D13_09035 [Erysipelotrichaceae bacterium]|nr:hypothetical protein [Erysipelotrichaceae bacterium]